MGKEAGGHAQPPLRPPFWGGSRPAGGAHFQPLHMMSFHGTRVRAEACNCVHIRHTEGDGQLSPLARRSRSVLCTHSGPLLTLPVQAWKGLTPKS